MSEEPHIVGKIEFENTTTDERLKDSMAQEIGELLRAKEELLNALYCVWPQLDGIYERKANEVIEKYK